MEWRDYDDFERKYGSDVNLDNATKRHAIWFSLDLIGGLLKDGFLDRETTYKTSFGPIWCWAKFKPIIEENRRRYNGKDFLVDLEYLAGEMLKMKLERDPSYKVPEGFAKYIPEKVSTQ